LQAILFNWGNQSQYVVNFKNAYNLLTALVVRYNPHKANLIILENHDLNPYYLVLYDEVTICLNYYYNNVYIPSLKIVHIFCVTPKEKRARQGVSS